MLTPAEELGLAGLSIASRVRNAFYQTPPDELAALLRRLDEEALRRNLIYLRDGKEETIRVLPCPVTVLPNQVAYCHSVTLTLLNALKRLPDVYLNDPNVHDVLRLEPEEDNWLGELWGPGARENNPVFARLDAVVDFISPMWKETLKFVEPNLSCVGGLHMVPACEQLLAEQVLPLITARDPGLRLEVGTDIRSLLMEEVLEQLQAIGRPARTLCFVEFMYAGAGPDEQGPLTDYFHEHYGLKVLHADPTELTLEGGEVRAYGEPVDIIYRDFEVRDLIELRREGKDVRPLRELFRQNRVVSSVAAELDQKACWEVFTDPLLAQRHFSAEERRGFRRHIPWTRVLADRRTLLADGEVGDLMAFARSHRETLVLKPNRDYGGKGVLIGHLLSDAEWVAALDRAAAGPGRWVVQQVVPIPVSVFPVLGPDGAAHVEPFYVVMGFAATRSGLAVLGRASQKQVVNVAQRGGLCGVLTAHPPGPLLGPGPMTGAAGANAPAEAPR
jgi:hypothetical protein